MNILFVSSEAAPYSKTGGLGDVAGVLPQELSKDHKVTLMIPQYKNSHFSTEEMNKIDNLNIRIGEQNFSGELYSQQISNNFLLIFIAQDLFFARKYVYGDSSGEYPDNFYRFLFFQKAIIHYLDKNRKKIDIIHLNDWQTALIPFLTRIKKNKTLNRSHRFLLTIHNIGYQGIFDKYYFDKLNVPGFYFSPEFIEFYGKINFLKAGIIYSDYITTVSPTYAREIQTKRYGAGLEGVIKKNASKLSGILNGADYNTWNPETDPFIYQNYSKDTLKKKETNKIKFLAEYKLSFDTALPLGVMISRLSKQKGIEIFLKSLPKLIKETFNLIILGKGERTYENKLKKLAKNSKKIKFFNTFNEKMAHQLQAAADILIMPSNYEPCGLSQIYSLKYGTIPIVRSTGGLEDTIEEYNPTARTGNGFKFKNINSDELFQTTKKALACFKKRIEWELIQKNGMNVNFSWNKSAKNYLTLYKRIKEGDKKWMN